jgi:hypothetical protein
VGRGRGGDAERVDLAEHLFQLGIGGTAVRLGHGARAFDVDVDDRRQLAALERGILGGMEPTEIADADDADAQRTVALAVI